MRSLIVALLLVLTSTALADDVRLAEILPALEGSDLGAVVVAEAPPVGATRVVRRSDVLAALRRAGRSAEGLDIPRASRVSREATSVDGDALAGLAMNAVRQAVAPCDVTALEPTRGTAMAQGTSISALGPSRTSDGRNIVTLVLDSGARQERIAAIASLTCPEPIVISGRNVRVVVVSGAVRASAAGVARQNGRVGDRVRVHMASGAALEGRVNAAGEVEVVP